MGITNFAQIMHNWQRMCEYFDEHYHEDCCHICPIHNCDAIWAMEKTTNWEEIEESINTWAAEHKEPIYPSWREYLKEKGLITSTNVYFLMKNETGARIDDILNENADCPIPAEIATALGLEPKYE